MDILNQGFPRISQVNYIYMYIYIYVYLTIIVYFSGHLFPFWYSKKSSKFTQIMTKTSRCTAALFERWKNHRTPKLSFEEACVPGCARELITIIIITGCWLGHPSEKYDFVNWDDHRTPIFLGTWKIDGNQPPPSRKLSFEELTICLCSTFGKTGAVP